MKLLYLIPVVALLLSCKHNNKTNKLSASLLDSVIRDLKQLNDTNLTRIKISQTEKDFLKVKKGEILSDSFIMINIGNKPLQLKGINAQCDCTTLNYVKNKIINPYDSLTVKYQIETSDMDKGYNKRNINVIGNFFPYYKNINIIIYIIE
ncbi:MAG: DUF1573 domain-containing protein [Bacteroidetes bacterium]|nr:DUF1573 domain-containing protein [Bacteroidota bacterium]